MSDAYERAKAGRLMFKGGTLATRSKGIDKKNKKKKQKQKSSDHPDGDEAELQNQQERENGGGDGGETIYTIDAAKKMKYEDLFPVEAKKFGYDPKFKAKSVEDALDDRVMKKADRYCK